MLDLPVSDIAVLKTKVKFPMCVCRQEINMCILVNKTLLLNG